MSRIIPSVYPISILKVNIDGEPVRNAKGLCQVCEPSKYTFCGMQIEFHFESDWYHLHILSLLSDEPGAFVGKIVPNNPSRAFLGYVDQKASEKKIVRDVFCKGDSAFISGII